MDTDTTERRRHRMLGHYMALIAWVHDLECVAISREDLLVYFGTKYLPHGGRDADAARPLDRLRRDNEPLFPYESCTVRGATGSEQVLIEIFSRRAIPEEFVSGGN
jgi:hypothetical protein